MGPAHRSSASARGWAEPRKVALRPRPCGASRWRPRPWALPSLGQHRFARPAPLAAERCTAKASLHYADGRKHEGSTPNPTKTVLGAFFRWLRTGFRNLRAVLEQIFAFVAVNARRANPRRERWKSRLALNLAPAGVPLR